MKFRVSPNSSRTRARAPSMIRVCCILSPVWGLLPPLSSEMVTPASTAKRAEACPEKRFQFIVGRPVFSFSSGKVWIATMPTMARPRAASIPVRRPVARPSLVKRSTRCRKCRITGWSGPLGMDVLCDVSSTAASSRASTACLRLPSHASRLGRRPGLGRVPGGKCPSGTCPSVVERRGMGSKLLLGICPLER